MEQRGDAPSETPSDPVDDEPEQSFVERYFWPLLAGVTLVVFSASAAVVYVQYSRVDQAVQTMSAATEIGSLPYADRVTQVLPYVGPDSSAASEPREYGSFTRIKGLVVNPAGSGGDRYLAVSIAFESKSPAVIQELSDKKVVVRDATLTLLSKRTVEELLAPDRRDELKRTLLKKTNRILSQGTVDRLYFSEFVLQ